MAISYNLFVEVMFSFFFVNAFINSLITSNPVNLTMFLTGRHLP